MRRLFYFLISFCLLSACTKEVEVYDSPANANLELPLLLNMDGKSIVLDISTKTMKYTVEEESYTNFEVFIEFNGSSKVFFEGKELTNNTINHLGNIEVNKAYEIEFISKETPKTFQLIFTNLSIVQLVLHDKIINEPKSLARMIVYENVDNYTPVSTFIAIEKRGASSLRNPKNSYGFRALNSFNTRDEKLSDFFNLGLSSTWILDAMYVDRGKLRNRTCFELWENMNTNASNYYNIDFKYVEVFINYKSIGLYTFNENFNYETLNLNPNSRLYFGKDNKPDTEFTALPKNSPKTSFWGSWEQKYPDTKERIEWDEFRKFCELIVEGSDAEFKATINDLTDVDLLIDYYLFVNLLNGYDNLGKNCGFVKKHVNQKFEIVPWDMDATLGGYHDGSRFHASGIVSNGLFDRLLELDPDGYKQKMKARWLDLRQNNFSHSNIISIVDSNIEVLGGSNIVEIENRVWDKSVDLNNERAYISGWLVERLTYLDDYFDNL